MRKISIHDIKSNPKRKALLLFLNNARSKITHKDGDMVDRFNSVERPFLLLDLQELNELRSIDELTIFYGWYGQLELTSRINDSLIRYIDKLKALIKEASLIALINDQYELSERLYKCFMPKSSQFKEYTNGFSQVYTGHVECILFFQLLLFSLNHIVDTVLDEKTDLFLVDSFLFLKIVEDSFMKINSSGAKDDYMVISILKKCKKSLLKQLRDILYINTELLSRSKIYKPSSDIDLGLEYAQKRLSDELGKIDSRINLCLPE